MNATVTCFVGDQRLSGATISCDGDEYQLDEHGSAVVRLGVGEVAFSVVRDGRELRRTFQRHGSSSRFAVDFAAEEEPDHPFPALPGLVGDRFRVEQVVARAETGTVVRAYDRLHDRLVALRAPSDELSAREEAHQVFVVEARNLLRLEHPNLLKIYDVLTVKGRAVLVTEWVVGDTLDLLMREGRVGPEAAWEIMLPIASAVAQLHAEDIVHRDLHGANIIVRPDGGAKLIDLGLARSLADVYLGAARVHETREHYAPEQLQGLHVSPATDVYQLTMLFYRCWSGHWPFDDDDLERAHVESEPAPLDAPDAIASLVARGLAKNPRERFVDAQAWFREFSGVQEVMSAIDERQAREKPDQRKWFVVAAVVLAVFAALMLVVLSGDGAEEEQEPIQLGGPSEPASAGQQAVATPREEPEAKPETPEDLPADIELDEADEAPADVEAPAETEQLPVEPDAARPTPPKTKRPEQKTAEKPEPDAVETEETSKEADAKPDDTAAQEAKPGSGLLNVDDGSGDSILLPVE